MSAPSASSAQLISQERRQREKRRFRGLRNFWLQYRKSKFGMTGLAFFLVFFLAALLAPWIAPYHPNTQGQFPKLLPSFAEPVWMGVFNPQAAQELLIGTTEGKFEVDAPDTTTFNTSNLGWTVRFQRTAFLLIIDKTNPSSPTIYANTPWEDFAPGNGITYSVRTIEDFNRTGNKVLHISFLDNDTLQEANQDWSEYGLNTSRYTIIRSTYFYRVYLSLTYDLTTTNVPKEFLGFIRYFVLSPADDNATEDAAARLQLLYSAYPDLNVIRGAYNNNGSELSDEKFKVKAYLNNTAYWSSSLVTNYKGGEGCPVNVVNVNDAFDLVCERISKTILNTPYYHGSWSAQAKRPFYDNADISTKPSDRVQLFKNPGKLEIGLSLEIQPDRVNDKGRIDIFFDDFFMTTGTAYAGILGADDQGQDVFSLLIYGARVSLIVGILATVFSLSIGVVVGLSSGYAGGLTDDIIMRAVDFLLIMPGLPLLLALAAILKPSIYNIIIVIAVLGWPGTARLIRSQVLVEKEKAYVESAKAAGASDSYILFKHILPNVLPLVFAIAATQVSGAILAVAALDFLQLGDTFAVSWGKQLQDASRVGAATAGYWWLIVPPGLAIALISLGFALIGYTTQQIINPRLRSRD